MRIVSFGCALLMSCASAAPLKMRTSAASTEEERLKSYEQYKAIKLNQITATQEDGTVIETGRYSSIELANQETISDPTMLAGLVSPGSVTKKASDTFAAKRKRERILLAIDWTGIVTSITLIGVGASLTDTNDTPTAGGTALLLSGSLLFVGLAVPGIMRLSATQEKKDARTEAFLAYNESLQKRLELCSEGEQVFSCEKVASLAAEQIAPQGSEGAVTVDSCREQQALGFSLSEGCEALLRRGSPQKAPDPTELGMREPSLAEQELSLLLSLAEVLMRAEKYGEALARLEDAKKVMPSEPILEFAFGEVYRSKGAIDEACEHYRAYAKKPAPDEGNLDAINRFLSGIDKKQNNACDFNPKKP